MPGNHLSEEERMGVLNVEIEVDGGFPDIVSFERVLDEKLRIFMERREQYGSHIENTKRFPTEHICGLYLKAARIIRDIEADEIKEDTLLDLSNYCDIVLSGMTGESETATE